MFNYLPESVLFNLGPVKIYWYGLLIVLAIIVCLLLIIKLSKTRGLSEKHLWNLFFYLIIFCLLGARLYHVLFYNFNYFISHPWDMVKVWQGGLAIHGAIITGLIVIYIYGKKYKLEIYKYLDIFAVVFPLGQAIGRWGNYFNQELFGRPCNFNWCISIKFINRPELFQSSSHFHPVFFYESFLNVILFLILILVFKSKKWPAGAVIFIYLIGYSTIRFFTEYLRFDASQNLLGLNWVQWLSLIIIVFILGFWKLNYKRGEL